MADKGPLPPGFEAKWDPGQKAYYFINHRDKTTSWVDPRTVTTQAAARTPQKALTPRKRNVVDVSKLIQQFPDCPDEILQSVIRSCESNTQTAINQLRLLGFQEINDQSVSSSHSTAVKGTTIQPKQHITPTRKPTQSYQYTADHGTGASTSNSERTSYSDSRAAQPSSHSSAHLVTDRSTNQRETDRSTNQRVTDTSTNQRITDTSTNQGITDTSTNQGITDTSTNQGITDTSTKQGISNSSSLQEIINTSSNQGISDTSTNQVITNRSSPQRIINTSSNQGITGGRRTDHNNKRSPKKTVYPSSIKDNTPTPANKQSVAVGRNRALQNGPDPTLRLSEHVPAHGHDPSLMQGPDSSRRAGSTGWVGADPSLCSTKRLIVTNI